jgi:hypothetical protein
MTSALMKQVLAEYLFGQNTKPNDLVDSSLIGRTSGTTIQIPLQDFMTTGAGRIALASMSPYLSEFFASGGPSLKLADIERYLTSQNKFLSSYARGGLGNPDYLFDKQTIEAAYVYSSLLGGRPDFSFDFQHYAYREAGESDLAFAERIFIWNSVEFSLGAETKFIYGANGDVWLEQFSIVPQEKGTLPFVCFMRSLFISIQTVFE